MATGWYNDPYESYGRAEPDEDTIPDPIYIKSTDLAAMRLRNMRLNEPDDINISSDEEENEGNLDLTAPPLESWFHGRISRPVACERLELVGDDGCYLVRESTHEQNEYILSYLSNSGHVYHFKIHSNCGDYYIGGRQFLLLSDLIGFYANCSCILENESLRVPVVPPKPVPLYLMLRASSSHIKNPNTDELNITPGEVYTLLSKLSDDWGWGRSQKTGDSGLIPIVIMEDVTHKDPNLGKPWFFSTVSRDEAVDLVEQSEVGSYLIRLSEGGGGEEVHYSMAVRTVDRVQRFRIIRYINGYYMFGGRPYSSMEDIIERYTKREVILDGLRLGSPVAMAQLSPQQLQPNRPLPVPRNRSNSKCITIDSSMPGDRAQMMELKKGKKSPVPGKWKEMYVVLKYSEQKLLFYENENSHRTKGLLDLKQCKVYAVHSSLYGRLDCFVVMLCYLNEISFHYLSTGTPEKAKEWVSLMRRCTNQGVQPELMEIQQSRSLTLGVKECKVNTKGCSQVFALVFIDRVCLGRTRIIPEAPYIFEESFEFEDLPQYAETFSCEVHSSKVKRLGGIVGKGTSLGCINVHMSDLPNGQADDQWHQLLGGGAKTAKGNVRLVANFKDLVILPLDEYNSLKELILSDDLLMIELLAQACKEHHAELASTLIQIFCHYDKVVPILIACLSKSIDKEANVGTLFRASTLSTMLMDQFMKLTASTYLRSLLKGPITQMVESQHSCEINPSYMGRGEDVSQNLARLEGHLQHVVSTIFKSVEDCPPALRFIFRALQAKVISKWPTDESVRTRAVSGFLFLRFVCPGLLKPQLFDLVSENPSPQADRALKLVTKGVQNLANLVEFKKKEDFTVSLNPFILRNMAPMRHFVDDLAKFSQSAPRVTLDAPDPRKDLATIFNLCSTYEKALQNLVKKEPDAKKLLGVMQSLRTTEKKYTNKAAAS